MTLTIETLLAAKHRLEAEIGPPVPELRVLTSWHVTQWVMERKQRRWPNSKKRRIQKKWAKNPRNSWSMPVLPRQANILKLRDGTLLMHPETWKRLQAQFPAGREGR